MDLHKLGDRTTGIGASEIAAVLGLSVSRTPVDVWLEKRGLADYAGRLLSPIVEPATTRAAEDIADADADIADPAVREAPEMAWGRALEPVIVNWYASTRGVTYDPRFDGTVAARDPEFLNVWATPDRVTTEPRIVEAKSVGWQMAYKWGTPGTDKVPIEYFCQVQVQQRATNVLADGHLAAAIAGRPPELWVIPHDAALAREMCARAQAWYERHVVGGEEPPARTPGDHAALVRATMQRAERRDAEVTPELRARVAALIEARRIAAEAAGLVKFHEARVKRSMGDCDAARLDGEWSISWRTNAKGSRTFRLNVKGE